MAEQNAQKGTIGFYLLKVVFPKCTQFKPNPTSHLDVSDHYSFGKILN